MKKTIAKIFTKPHLVLRVKKVAWHKELLMWRVGDHGWWCTSPKAAIEEYRRTRGVISRRLFK